MLKVIFNTLLGLVLVFVWLQFVNLEEILKTLSSVAAFSLLPIFLFLGLAASIRAFRLKIILSKIQKISFVEILFLNGAAMILNFLIPIRGGEIAKSFYLSQKYNLPLAKTLVWIFIDRFVDFLAVFILGAILLLLIPTNLGAILLIILLSGAIILATIAYLIIFKVDFSRILFKFLIHLLIFNRIKIYFDNVFEFLISSFNILKRSPQELLMIFIVTVLAYGADAYVWYFSFAALGISQDYFKMYLGQLLSALTYLIPAAPGFIGSAEASGLLIFTGVFGIDPNLASSMTVLFHVCTAIFIVTFGIISIYKLDLNVGAILKRVLNRA